MRLLKPVLLLLVVGGLGWAGYHYTRAKPTEAPPSAPVPVSAAQAKTGDVPVYLTTIGNIRALNSVDVRPQVGGVLIDVPVREGDDVKKDQVLAVVDPRPLKAALDRANAQLQQDQAQLQNAELDRQRYASLARSDFASRQQLDTQTSTVSRMQGVVDADKASISEAQINLGYAVLKSPIDGRIGIRRVDPGNLIQANQTQPVITIVQEKPTSALFTIPETDLIAVRDAAKQGTVQVLADAPQTARTLATGTLTTIDNTVDTSTGSIQLRATFPNEDEALTAGQFVNIRIQTDVAHGVVVPHTAVQHAQTNLFVFTVKPDKTVDRKEVTVGYDNGEVAVLKTGLDDGTTVITAGQTRIGPGSKVAFKQDGNQPEQTQQSAEK